GCASPPETSSRFESPLGSSVRRVRDVAACGDHNIRFPNGDGASHQQPVHVHPLAHICEHIMLPPQSSVHPVVHVWAHFVPVSQVLSHMPAPPHWIVVDAPGSDAVVQPPPEQSIVHVELSVQLMSQCPAPPHPMAHVAPSRQLIVQLPIMHCRLHVIPGGQSHGWPCMQLTVMPGESGPAASTVEPSPVAASELPVDE